jgi:hypothetical protein
MEYRDERNAFERSGGGGVYLDLKKPQEFWEYKTGLIIKKYCAEKTNLLSNFISDVPQYELLNPYAFVFAWMIYDDVTVINQEIIKRIKKIIKDDTDLSGPPTKIEELIDIFDVVRYTRLLYKIKHVERVEDVMAV